MREMARPLKALLNEERRPLAFRVQWFQSFNGRSMPLLVSGTRRTHSRRYFDWSPECPT